MTDSTFNIKTETESSSYGLYSIEPLEQGYGQTMGNSLRRVLLTSLQGCAITSIKVEGVKHQFSTLEGMKEDVVELLLNLKKVRLTIQGNEPVHLSISKKGPCQVTAGDIEVPAGVTIVNPDVVIATLSDKKADLNMEITAEKGYGYVSTEEKHIDEIGMIPVAALFSPVTRVNYRVEATRVGRMTNLDKLVMEIWTDGSISPRDALKQAAKILVTYFVQVYEPKVQENVESAPVVSGVSEEMLKMRIEELDVPTRIVNALANGSIETVGQMLNTPRSELMKIKNLGAKSLSIVEDKLKEKGIVLA